jgi:DNA processing protein
MTTIFGLDRTEIGELTAAVSAVEDLEEVFARSAWSGIAEPGDKVAGLIVTSIGAPAALTALIDHQTVEQVVRQLKDAGVDSPDSDEIRLGLDRWQPRLKADVVRIALRQAGRCGARLILPSDPLWPRGLNDLEDYAPLALWLRGRVEAVAALETSIALVGARAATGYGEHVTMEASAGLVDRGYAIVSGAAYGIDGMAHRAALASHGLTVAFLAGGVDRFYPSGHDALLTRIVESGAVMSELPCGQAPTKWRFLQRNRLIAAVSQATVVLEAGWRSGSLNTAGHAAQMGRPLGAVPGPVTSAASAGCHRLIREFNAVCVTNADEMAELAPLASLYSDTVDAPDATGQPNGSANGSVTGQATDEGRLLDALSARSQRAAADLAARAGLSLARVQSLLGGLELEGRVVEGEKGWKRLA